MKLSKTISIAISSNLLSQTSMFGNSATVIQIQLQSLNQKLLIPYLQYVNKIDQKHFPIVLPKNATIAIFPYSVITAIHANAMMK